MVDAVDNKLYADEITTPQITATSTLTLTSGGQTIIEPTTDLRLNPTGVIYANTTLFDITGPLTVSGTISGNVTGNLTGNSTGYHTGDVTGSVFADDSTKLVDAVEGKIVGPIESESISGNLTGSVFADDSTTIIDGPTGTVAGIHVPGSTTPASEFADGQTYEIRVDDSFIWVKTSTGAWKKATLGSF